MFRLFLTEHSFPRGCLGHKDVGFFSSFVSRGTLFRLLVWFVFPALFLGLCSEFVSARGRAQNLPSGWDVTLTRAMPTWILWPDLLKGLCFAEDTLKVSTLSFQIPKGYLKWNKKQEFSSLVLQYVVQVNSLSCVWLFLISWTVSYQDPLSMEFSRQEHWSGLPFPSPGDLSDPGIEPRSPTLQADTLPSLPPGKSPGEGKHYPLQYSGLENSMECIVHGVTKNQTKSDD